MNVAKQRIKNIRSMATYVTVDAFRDCFAVTIDQYQLKELEKVMYREGKVKHTRERLTATEIIMIELIANSVNYCFWYGCSYNKISGGSEEVYNEITKNVKKYKNDIPTLKSNIKEYLISNSFVLLDERLKHIDEIFINIMTLVNYIKGRINDDVLKVLSLILIEYSGFASDVLLKRAILCLMQIHRRLGYWKQTIHKLPVPADYRLPSYLHTKGVLRYSDKLNSDIINGKIIHTNSLEEADIRLSTINVCRTLAENLKWTESEVDEWLYSKARENNLHHLTLTTDY